MLFAGGCAPFLQASHAGAGAAIHGFAYRIRLRSHGTLDLGGIHPQNHVERLDLRSDVAGDLDWIPTGKPFEFVCRFHPKNLSVKAGGKPSTLWNASRLELPFLITLDRRGVLSGFRFLVDCPPKEAQLLVAICADLQPQSVPPQSNKVQVEAPSPTGIRHFSAVLTHADPTQRFYDLTLNGITPAGERFGAVLGTGKLMGVYKLENGKFQIARLTGSIVESTHVDGKTVSRSENLVSALRREETFLRSTDCPASLIDRLRQRPRTEVAKTSASNDNDAIQRTALGDTKLDEILQRLQPLVDEKASGQSTLHLDLYLKVVAELTLNAESVKPIEAVLERSSEESSGFRLISQALASAGTPECQSALIRATIQSQSPRRQADLLSLLAQVKSPTPAMVNAVQELGATTPDASIRGLALLLEGAFVRNLAANNPALAQKLDLDLTRRYEAATTNEERITLLAALGNARTRRAMQTALAAMGSGDEAVRYAALSATNSFELEVVIELALHVLETDPSSRVRALAASIVGPRVGRTGDLSRFMASLHDGSEAVRLQVVDGLSRLVKTNPHVRESLEWVAKADNDDTVREEARRALGISPI